MDFLLSVKPVDLVWPVCVQTHTNTHIVQLHTDSCLWFCGSLVSFHRKLSGKFLLLLNRVQAGIFCQSVKIMFQCFLVLQIWSCQQEYPLLTFLFLRIYTLCVWLWIVLSQIPNVVTLFFLISYFLSVQLVNKFKTRDVAHKLVVKWFTYPKPLSTNSTVRQI